MFNGDIFPAFEDLRTQANRKRRRFDFSNIERATTKGYILKCRGSIRYHRLQAYSVMTFCEGYCYKSRKVRAVNTRRWNGNRSFISGFLVFLRLLPKGEC